uniref:Uncharacterized protein n=1 Tax=Arundo donax TaxID=35708 RepID=A0A0A9HKR0_ARUDO
MLCGCITIQHYLDRKIPIFRSHITRLLNFIYSYRFSHMNIPWIPCFSLRLESNLYSIILDLSVLYVAYGSMALQPAAAVKI